MRIAVVSPYGLDVPGGVQTQVLEIVAGLRDRGHIAWAVGPGQNSDESFRSTGPHIRVPANRSVAPLALGPRVVRRTKRALAEAEVVHLHEPFMPLTSWAALGTHARLVVTFHADPSPLMRAVYKLGAPVTRHILRKAGALTAVSQTAATAVAGISPVIIPNGITLPELGTEERNRAQVAFLGRDEGRKGLDILLDAWPTVMARIPHANLVVMGAQRTHLPPGVTALGPVAGDEKWNLLRSSAVFCAPNLGGESFGITLLEGMAAGCAPVATDLPAFTHLLAGSGVQARAGDPLALADALAEVLGNPSHQAELAQMARRRAEEFSWPKVLDAYEAAYLGLTADSP